MNIGTLTFFNMCFVFLSFSCQKTKPEGRASLQDEGKEEENEVKNSELETKSPAKLALSEEEQKHIQEVFSQKSKVTKVFFVEQGRAEIQYKDHIFFIPDDYILDPEASFLGKGAFGMVFGVLCIKTQCEIGKKYVLKYFKEPQTFDQTKIIELKKASKESLINSFALSRFKNQIKGPYEDIVFHTQQAQERELLSKQQRPQSGVGAIQVKEIEGEYKKKGQNIARKILLLVKERLQGKTLKYIIEKGLWTKAHGDALELALREMSDNGMFYDDLNEANWIFKEQEDGSYIAYPFDMKPGVKLENTKSSLRKNAIEMKHKIIPHGMSTDSKRSVLIAAKKTVGKGLFHADVSSENSQESMKQIQILLRNLSKSK